MATAQPVREIRSGTGAIVWRAAWTTKETKKQQTQARVIWRAK